MTELVWLQLAVCRNLAMLRTSFNAFAAYSAFLPKIQNSVPCSFTKLPRAPTAMLTTPLTTHSDYAEWVR